MLRWFSRGKQETDPPPAEPDVEPNLGAEIIAALADAHARSRRDAFLPALADRLLDAGRAERLGLYAADEGQLTRVAIAVSADSVDHHPTDHHDEPEATLPRTVPLSPEPAPHGDAAWIMLPKRAVWILAAPAARLRSLIESDAQQTKALETAVMSTARSILERRRHRRQQIDADVHHKLIRAAVDQSATVDLFLGAAIAGMAGQRGFVGLLRGPSPEAIASASLDVLAISGDIRPDKRGLHIDSIGPAWIATIAEPKRLAEDAKALYALARAVHGGVLVCVIASAKGAEALSEATSDRVERALEIIASLHDAEEETKRARARGAAMIEALAEMVDSDPSTPQHHRQVRRVAAALADALEVSGVERESVLRAAEVHDVGRVAPSSDPSGTAMEFLHPQVGGVVLESFGESEAVVRLVSLHHERADGMGFPGGQAPSPEDRGAWALIAAEAIVELSELKRLEPVEAARTWLQEVRGVLPEPLRESLSSSPQLFEELRPPTR